MLYLTCTTISSVDLAHYAISRAQDWVSVDFGTSTLTSTSSLATDLYSIYPSKLQMNMGI